MVPGPVLPASALETAGPCQRQDLGFRVWGSLGFRVLGFGIRVDEDS